jgi:hypothetical protein
MKKAEVKLGEILFILSMAAPMVVALCFGVWPLFFMFLAFNVIFGIVEVLYVKFTGKTISQHFWTFSKANRLKAIVMLVCMGVMWASLIAHLASKM